MTYSVNRLEVIDHTDSAEQFGRAFVKRVDENFKVEIQEQDDGRTLKIFIDDICSTAKSKEE